MYKIIIFNNCNMNIKNIPLYFILGGTILVSICLLAEYVNPTAAALLWGVPIISMSSYFILNYETKNRKLIYNTNRDIIIYSFVKLIFFFSLLLLLSKTDLNTVYCLLISISIFFIFAISAYFVIRSNK